MKNLNKTLTILITVLFGMLTMAQAVGASYVSSPYGEVPTEEIEIEKKVKNPATGDFVDRLNLGDYQFTPGEEMTFKVKVTNYGESNFEKVKVVDYLPEYVELVSLHVL